MVKLFHKIFFKNMKWFNEECVTDTGASVQGFFFLSRISISIRAPKHMIPKEVIADIV